ncbi:hypothetical protein MUK42_34425 [Musa troglodytarum]|uniref:Ferredoxin-thioredoxin reductase catalytic chain, chloroplastic n=1 Tax=Musa troglodytarum TaxID=320322 RepID=A0A9E7HLE3_9LILI|nr:hypothetical protein MUK42_34425 [Musa troglodytarum]
MSIQNAFPGVVLPSLTPATSSRHRPRRLMVRAKVEPSDNSVEVMRKFSEQYAYHSGTSFCVDKGVVIKGLVDHRDSPGAPSMSLQVKHYDYKAAEVAQGFWNCPCVPMRETRIEVYHKVNTMR